MLIFIIASAADLHGQTDFLLNILALCSAFLKFRQKGELLRSYMLARMHVLLLDTFLLILAASHTFVRSAAYSGNSFIPSNEASQR